MYIGKIKCSNTDPCGTPQLTEYKLEFGVKCYFLNTTENNIAPSHSTFSDVLSARKFSIFICLFAA